MKKIALTLIFCLILGVFSLGGIILPDREFSENENRNLTTFPKITLSGVTSGDWQGKINGWYSDQLPGRDALIALKTRLQKLCGKRDIGGVYLCGKDFYIEKKLPTEDSQKIFTNNLSSVSEFFHKNSKRLQKENMTLMLVPSAAYILEDLLPKGAKTLDYKAAYLSAENLGWGEFSDLRETLAENPAHNYYKTDHHWTTDGAFKAYKTYCEDKGITPKNFVRETVSKEFFGTTYSKALDPDATPDEVVYYRSETDEDYTLTADGETLGGIYDYGRLETKDKYTFFMGGNYGEVKIENCGGEGHLLVIKDSFANCFLPFLLPHYDSVTVIDPRYFVGSVEETIKTNNITDILVLYGLDTFMEEKSVPSILS